MIAMGSPEAAYVLDSIDAMLRREVEGLTSYGISRATLGKIYQKLHEAHMKLVGLGLGIMSGYSVLLLAAVLGGAHIFSVDAGSNFVVLGVGYVLGLVAGGFVLRPFGAVLPD